MTSAERWAVYFLYNADESKFARDLIEEIARKEQCVKMARKVMNDFSADEARYLQLMSMQKGEWDQYNRMAEAEERGRRYAAQALADRDAVLAGKNAVIAEKDAALADKDAENAQ
jgi:hypothetical protein